MLSVLRWSVPVPKTIERERDEWRAIASHLLRVHAVEECVDCKAASQIAQDLDVARPSKSERRDADARQISLP